MLKVILLILHIQGSPKYIWPPTGYRIQVPRRAAIRYHRNVIRISFRRVLKTFRHIKKLIFWTGFNGTQIFVRNAPPGLLFGGGECNVCLHHTVDLYIDIIYACYLISIKAIKSEDYNDIVLLWSGFANTDFRLKCVLL